VVASHDFEIDIVFEECKESSMEITRGRQNVGATEGPWKTSVAQDAA
jgi:hypothetical protein